MKKILTAHLHFFRNEAHYEFMVVFRNLLLKFSAVQAVVAALYSAFTALLAKEEALINAMRKSDYTKQIADADHRVDRTITGMHGIISAAAHHFDPAMVAAAQSLHNRFAAFGDIAKKSYEEETAAVNLLIADLNSPEYTSKVALIGMAPWVTELQTAETEFERLLGERNVEIADKPQGQVRGIRHEIDKVYHPMINRIDAADTMDGTGAYIQFILELNAEITYFNEHNHHHARKDISVGDHCVVEEIGVQKYTGKAVTPIPKGFYREDDKPTVELTFAKDFSVTYKDNEKVGTAEVTLHGKGAYKGQKTVTFNIAR
jgi:hypothetical protein